MNTTLSSESRAAGFSDPKPMAAFTGSMVLLKKLEMFSTRRAMVWWGSDCFCLTWALTHPLRGVLDPPLVIRAAPDGAWFASCLTQCFQQQKSNGTP